MFGPRVENTLGLRVRNNGLYQSQNRVEVDKTESSTGHTLPATTQADHLTDTQPGYYAESKIQWAERFRSVVAMRGDVEHFSVTSQVEPANSGTATKVLPSPKVSLTFGPWVNSKMAQSGELLNLLNRKDHDIDYADTSWVTPTATPALQASFIRLKRSRSDALTRTF